MRLAEVGPETNVAAYDPETGEYISLGSGFEGSDHARSAAEGHIDGEYILVAELGHVGPLDDEG